MEQNDVTGARCPAFPPEWISGCEALSLQFGLQMDCQVDRVALQAGELYIEIRVVQPDNDRWAVFALRVLEGDDAEDPGTSLHFAWLNHRSLHLIDNPVILAFNPDKRAWEALFQMALDGLQAAEWSVFFALYLQSVNALLGKSLGPAV